MDTTSVQMDTFSVQMDTTSVQLGMTWKLSIPDTSEPNVISLE